MYVLRGYVRDLRGTAKAGEEVALFKGEAVEPTETTTTNALGQWSFEVSDPAAYRIRAEYDDVAHWLEPDNCVQFGLLTGLDGITAPLAPDSLTHDHLRDGTITTVKIADGAITGEKILPGSLSPEDLGEGALGSDIFPEESLEERHLAPDSIKSSSFAKHAILPIHVRDGNTPVHASDAVRLSAPTERSLTDTRAVTPQKMKEFLVAVSGTVRVAYDFSGTVGEQWDNNNNEYITTLRPVLEVYRNSTGSLKTTSRGVGALNVDVQSGDKISLRIGIETVGIYSRADGHRPARATLKNVTVGWSYDTLDGYRDNEVLED